MKQIAPGRKNWLVIGSIAAGERAVDLIMLVSSALRNDLDAAAHFKDILDRVLAGDTCFHAMRPDFWKQSHPEAVRIYRQVERRDQVDAKPPRHDRRRRATTTSR